MTNNKKAYLFALTSIFLWSTVASAFKISLRYLSPIELLFFASITSVFVLFLILVLQGKLSLLKKSSKADWYLAVKFGFLNPFLYYLVLLHAYNLLPAQQAQAINYTWAITLSLLSVPLLKQNIRKPEIIAVVIGYIGVVVIGSGGSLTGLESGSIKGIFLAIVSTIIWALYWIFNTKDKRDPIVGLLMNFVCGLPFITIYMVAENRSLAIAFPKINGLFGAAYIGVFEMGIAFVCWLFAMKVTKDTVKIANLIFLSPILSLFFIHYFVGEKILPTTIIGLALILFGLAIQVRSVKSD